MAHIHFIDGEKSGVGKSLVARILAQYLIDHERPFLGFDTDHSHGALMRFYAGYVMPVSVDQYESLDAIMEAVVADPQRHLLVDMAAQTQDAHALGLLERQRVKMWLKNAYNEIDTLLL